MSSKLDVMKRNGYGRKLTQHILFRANNIDRACYMLTLRQWAELKKISKRLAEIDNDVQERA